MDVQDVIPLPNKLEWNGSPAAVSMAVRAGNFLDPPEAQGYSSILFLTVNAEHMLFLGSDKFPMENALDNYLNMHGGDSVAATDDDHTIFFLFAESKLLKHVLDMFARPFIAPLMKPDSMNREIKSIDSEFEILKQSDTHRLYQLRRHTSKNDHAYNRFTAGTQ
ncbi:PREDICTED: zinc-metallopeptidase, peroxisomal-like [Brassica oleracea var. oleracea]|uniref:zinc-metallopeptidase, peroxisomal-like n=1 Tax=Brassica oleracea var. oleracea TaxID=109376 RepID=UPI0006A6A8D3|nr:PREDICTED: zinc-metallopeptidase, peroxisomal-like [Brassica oleracea var. oleracea]